MVFNLLKAIRKFIDRIPKILHHMKNELKKLISFLLD